MSSVHRCLADEDVAIDGPPSEDFPDASNPDFEIDLRSDGIDTPDRLSQSPTADEESNLDESVTTDSLLSNGMLPAKFCL